MPGRVERISVWAIAVLFILLSGGGYWLRAHRASVVPTIAFVPQAPEATRWEAERQGATVASRALKCHLYWNAPTSETDVAGQVSLIDRIGRGKYQGLVLAPNHPLAILVPLRRLLAAGLPVVIVSSPLDLPANGKLGYVINDDEKMGEIAAGEIAKLIHGRGSIALVGLSRYGPGITPRARGAERFLTTQFPNIQVVSRLTGAYNSSRAEELAIGVLDSHPELKAVLSLTAASTRGVHAALKRRSKQETIPLVGCEQDSDLIGFVGNGEIAALLAENTSRMGYEAVHAIAASWAGTPIPARSVVPPLLITRQNLNSPEANILNGRSQ